MAQRLRRRRYAATRRRAAAPPFSDDFNRADGAAGNDWTGAGAAISSNRLVITPAVGPELVTNGSFAAWTGDNPDGWTVTGEAGGDPEVSEVGSGESHGGSGSGLCNLYSSATNVQPQLSQSGLTTVGTFYQVGLAVDTRVSGVCRVISGGALIVFDANAAGAWFGTYREVSSLVWRSSSAPTDITIDNVSVKALGDLLAYRAQSSALAAAEVRLWRTAYTQAGLVHYADADNFVLAYLDGGSNVKLVKRVAGTYTEIASAAIAYSAGAVLELAR
ncbi:MAG: hypothetical protein JW910_17630, partial [Anaerolineae bacterium]|nr:hypothetical protein [Anaerolineae bacterium]